MTEAVDHWPQQKRTAITAMFGVSLVTGIVVAAIAPNAAETGMPLGIQLVANVVLFVLAFRWLQADSAQLGITRPTWLNVGIILLAAVFVPYYLYKTRPEGARLVPILAFVGLIFGCAMASAIGTLLMAAIQPGSPPAATF
jgi:peptidoglycan/LPS O-acetylase OafA/YrhL